MNNFSSLGLSQPVLKAVADLGYVTPTPIQQEAIPMLLSTDSDMVGLAQTGTGKTAAFGLPLVDLVDENNPNTQALVLAPTRELCVQITKELELFAKAKRGLGVRAVYGGVDIVRQMKSVRKGAHIIAATPGRLRDLIRRKAIKLEHIDFLILDEADEMLNMGFKEEIDDILQSTPDDKRTWLFSATMPHEVRKISQDYMDDPIELNVATEQKTNADIEHQYVVVRPQMRYEVLKRFLDVDPNVFGLVFTRTRRDAKEVAEKLTGEGYPADALHGDLNQAQRDRVMAGFRSGMLKICVATDVAARGIDVSDITHVFHYNIPDDYSFYTHRAGRTGRAGSKGISLVLCHPKDVGILKALERRNQIRFNMANIPTGQEICERRLMAHIEHLKTAQLRPETEDFMPEVLKAFEGFTRDQVLELMVSSSFNRLLKQYKGAPDLNPRERGKKRSDATYAHLFINVGTMDGFDKGSFLNLICTLGQIPGSSVGKINMRNKNTFFDVELEMAKRLMQQDGKMLEGRALRINEDKPSHKGVKRKKGGVHQNAEKSPFNKYKSRLDRNKKKKKKRY